MSTQVGQLKAIQPKTLIQGFSATIKKQNTSIVADWKYETLVIDYYFEVTVICDGTNPRYRTAEYFTVLVSQLIETCELEFFTNCPILMLGQHEQLTGITVQHGAIEKQCGVWLVFSVQNFQTKEESVRGYLFQED